MFENFESIKIGIALTTVVVVFATLFFRRSAPTEILFSLALTLFVVCGVTTPERAWQSFSDPAVIAIAGMLIVSSALRTSGVLDYVGHSLLGSIKTEASALRRLSGVVIAGSAFLLNTAIVAILMPLVIRWCRRLHIAPSRVLLPISYMAILGGTCTLVGTSTNFVINGQLREVASEIDRVNLQPVAGPAAEVSAASSKISSLPLNWLNQHRGQFNQMMLTDISWVGVPCALAGAILLIFFARKLLPERSEMLESLEEHRREYLVEMLVTADCQLIGQTVEEGGLRHLPGLFLIEIDRDGEVIAPISPSERIDENDRLVFTGVVATIVDLEKIPGLIPAADINYEIATDSSASRSLVEVVLSPSSPLVGSTVRQANFRQHYGAAVVAVHRNGERLPSKIGDIQLSPGDTLLLQTQDGFVRSFRNRPDFYLVSDVEGSDSRRHDKLWLATGITSCLIAWLLLMPLLPHFLSGIYADGIPQSLMSAPVAISVAAMAMIVSRCLSVADARRAIDLPLLLTVGAAIGVGRAISDCGAAELVADVLFTFVGQNPHLALAAVFLVTIVCTEMVSNVAVAATMFFVSISVAAQLGVSPRPFIMAVTMAASLSFVSPIGYQTNLMVMGPGGYRPTDYLRAGLPLSILVSTLAIILIPLIWPFH